MIALLIAAWACQPAGPDTEADVDVDVDADSDVDTDSDTDTDTGNPMKTDWTLLSLNLHCLKCDGTRFSRNEDRFAFVAALVRDEEVDVIALQEVCKTTTADALAALQRAVEASTGESWSSSWAFAHVGWEGTADEADEGLGLLVRGTLSEPIAHEYLVQAGLRRVLLSAALSEESRRRQGFLQRAPRLGGRPRAHHAVRGDRGRRAGPDRPLLQRRGGRGTPTTRPMDRPAVPSLRRASSTHEPVWTTRRPYRPTMTSITSGCIPVAASR